MRQLDFEREATETIEEAATRMAEIIYGLTTNFVAQISCDEIDEKIEQDTPFLVYFGIESSISEGQMKHFYKVATHDRFTFIDEEVEFFFNSDKACAERRQFDSSYPSVALYVN
jgi:hypothetical protein